MRIFTCVTREAHISAGGVGCLGYHVAWCPNYRRRVLADWVTGRREGLIRSKADQDGWRIVALELMPAHMHLFMEAHRSDCPSRHADQVKGLSSRCLRAEFPHLLGQLSALWSWRRSPATIGAACAETVRPCSGTQDERPWQQERVQ